MNIAVDVALNEEIVNSLCVFVLASVSSSEDSANTDGVLVNEVYSLLGVDDVTILGAVDILLLDIEVPAGFLSAGQSKPYSLPI
jgi:hypothetical protein